MKLNQLLNPLSVRSLTPILQTLMNLMQVKQTKQLFKLKLIQTSLFLYKS